MTAYAPARLRDVALCVLALVGVLVVTLLLGWVGGYAVPLDEADGLLLIEE